MSIHRTSPTSPLVTALMLLALQLMPTLASAATEDDTDAEEIEWSALIPAGWEPAAPSMDGFFDDFPAPAMDQSFDAPVVEAMHDKRVALVGWLVPLEYERAEEYHEFLLVPYFGACTHVPPPPANQVVHVFVEDGVGRDELFKPQRVTGRLRVDTAVTALAAAAYRMEKAISEVVAW